MIKKVLPFCYDAMTSYPFIEKDFDALTQYEINAILTGKVMELIGQCNDVADLVNELKAFVDNYFENLDVQKEINTKLDMMVADGTFSAIVKPLADRATILEVQDQIPELVTDWLNDHISGDDSVVIDTSLSTKEACADAFNTGFFVKTLAKYNCGNMIAYEMPADSTNLGVTYTWSSDGTCLCQGTPTGSTENLASFKNIYFDDDALPDWIEKGKTYYVVNDSTRVFFDIWFYKDGAMYLAYETNASNSPRYIQVPTDAEGLLLRLKIKTTSAIDERVTVGMLSGTPNNVLQNGITYNGVYPNDSDIDDITTDGYYLLTGNSSAPEPYGTLFHLNVSGSSKMQIEYRWNSLAIYYRRYILGSWREWYVLDSVLQGSQACSYLAFGDSLMTGSLWNDGDPDPVIIQAPEGYRIPDRIAHALKATDYHNYGVGGMAYTHADGAIPKMIDYMQTSAVATRIRNADIITVAGGRNDGSYNLGTYTDTTDSTICGAINNIIDYIRSINKTCQIVIIQVTPYTQSNQPWTAASTSGWTLNSYDVQIKQIAEAKNVGYASWYGCSLFSCWSDLSGGGNNYAHMKDAHSYFQMGNFIAGKITGFYQN